MNPETPALVGLDWPPLPSPAFTLHAQAPAPCGQTVNATWIIDRRMASLLFSPRACTALDSIQTGVRRYLMPLGVDPAEITWTCQPVARPEPS